MRHAVSIFGFILCALVATPAIAGYDQIRNGDENRGTDEMVATEPEILLLLPELGRDQVVNWDRLLDRDQSPESPIFFGVHLLGPAAYTRNDRETFLPASNAKLFTAGAALRFLGPEFRFETRLEWQRLEDSRTGVITGLTLFASGDPTWGMIEFNESLESRLQTFARALREKGVREIRGPIRLLSDDVRWDHLSIPSGWEPQDLASCYGATVQSFNLNLNCATLVINGPKSGRWQEKGVPLQIWLRIAKGRKTSLRIRGTESGFAVTGTWVPGTPAQAYYLPVRNPRQWIGNLFQLTLRQEGILLTRARGIARAATDGDSIQFQSPPLREILKPMMKQSLNVVAESLFKTMGQHSGKPLIDLVQAGQEVMRDYVTLLGSRESMAGRVPAFQGLHSATVSLMDGSGLSRESRVTPLAIATLLRELKLERDFRDFWNALSIAGVDGTLRKRMRGTAADGFLRGKTGTLDGVYNLAGYVDKPDSSGAVDPANAVPFVILSRTTLENHGKVIAATDRVGVELARRVKLGIN